MAKVKITQIKSVIKRSKRQKATMIALGLRKIGMEITKENSPQVQGMINKVNHLIKVEQV